MRAAKQILVGSLTTALAVTGLAALAAPAQAVEGVFLSEFHYDDGTTNDGLGVGEFVEVTAPAGTSLEGWKVQLVNGNGGSVYRTDTLTGTVPDQVDGWGTAVVAYPTTSSTLQNGSPDGIALINASGAVVEFISYEGEMTALLGEPATSVTSVDTVTSETNTTNEFHSLQRNVDGSWAAPAPHTKGEPNGQTSGTPAPLEATDPGDKTFRTGAPITPVALVASGGTPPYEWALTEGTLPDGLVLGSDGTLTGTPTTVTTSPVELTVTVTDDDGATASATFTVTVEEALPITPIAELQGTGARSPFAPASGNGTGAEVKSTEGVVTAAYPVGGFNGLYVQTPGADTPGASDGIFVYGGSGYANIPDSIEVGDSVQVTGRLAEFYDLTQIVPGPGGVVELSEPLGAVEPRAVPFATTDAEREAREGELIDPTGAFTVSNVYQTNQYGEVGLASGEGPLKQPSEYADATDPAALQAVKDENARRAVILDDGATTNYLGNQSTKALPVPWLTGADGAAAPVPPRVGAGVTLEAPVVLDYRNDAWKFQPQGQVTTDGATVATFEDTRAANLQPADVLGVEGDVKIATFNVLNYFTTTGEAYVAAGPLQSPPVDTHCTYYTDRQGNRIGNNQCGTRGPGIASPNDGRGPRGAATAESLARQEAKLARTLAAMDADVVALEEIENSIKLPGETNRDEAVARVVELLNDIEGAGTWKYVRSPGEATTASAVAEQDTIRNAFIYRPAAVTPVGQSDMLFGTTEFANAREPLAQAFKKVGAPDAEAFAVIVNHFKSKGDNRSPAPPATGDNANTDDTGAFNGDRKRQAARLVQFADDFAAERDVEAIFLAGDFNAYSGEEPVGIIEDGGYSLIESDTPGEESYSHSGLSGSLDHVFANPAAKALVTGADIWEINANEPISFQYSRHNYNVTDLWQPELPFATSDHNPEVVGLNLPDGAAPAYDEIQVVGTNDFHGRLLPDGGNAAGAAPFATAVDELRAQNPNTIFVAAGDLVGASTFESNIAGDVPTIKALNAMGLEVSAAGNHELDKGHADLAGRIEDLADWEYIAANLEYDDTIATEDRLATTWTKTIDGRQVGFVGAITEDLPRLVNPDGIQGLTVTDVVDATNAAAAQLRADGADVVVLLVHEGSPSTDCGSASFTDAATTWGNIVQNTSADVDAIISGHTHLAYNCRITVEEWADRPVTKRPVVSAGQYGTNLNKLVFQFEGDTLAGITQEVIATAGVGYAPDAEVQEIVDAAVAHAETEGASVLGKMTGPFERARYLPGGNATENRGGESTLGNQVAEAQRWATDRAGIDTDIAFMNPGGLRADMEGVVNGDLRDLTYRQAADVQPFANTLVNMKLTGEQIETVLEQQWQRTPTGGVPSRPFLRLGVSEGFTYTYSQVPEQVTAPNSAPVDTFRGEVTGMWLHGEPIDLGRTYSVTVNSFLASGGDNFTEFANGTDAVDSGQVDLAAMSDYMAQYDAANPLVVDHSQRAVELELPADAPASYGPGDTVTFEVGSWAMSAEGDTTDAELEVRLGEQLLGTFPVDNTIGGAPYDGYGTASVSVTLPDDLTAGMAELTVSGAATGTSVPPVIAVDDGSTKIQVLGTNDFHGRILQNAGSREAGAAVLSGAVKQLRGEHPNTVFAAGGDLIGASTFESFIQNDKPTIDALNEAGLDVSAVGNHELDQGYDDLVTRVLAPYDAATNPTGGAKWTYLAANLKMKATGDDAVPATWIKTLDGVDVGFVGAVTEDLPSLVSPAGIADLQVADIVDSVNAEAADLRANGADIVVMLVHEGSASTNCASPQFTDVATTWGNITQNVSGDVDAIISGHTHLAYSCSFPVDDWVDEGRAVTERPVVSAGQYGMNLNQLLFTVDDSGVTGVEVDLLPLMTEDPDGRDGPEKPTALYPADPKVQAIVEAAAEKADELGAEVLGQVEGPLNRARLADATEENRGGESTLGNMVAEVQRWATEQPESGSAEIAFMNPGGLRDDLVGTPNGAARDVTYKQAAVVQPFANTLVNMKLTGAQIETVLEQQWQRTAAGGVPSRPFLRLGTSEGFTYTYVETPETVGDTATFRGEVTGMWLHGEPIDLARSYSVTVNSFLASGGDNFHELANGADPADTGKIDLQAMVDHLAEHAADAPLPLDRRQHAVEVEFPADAPGGYGAGEQVRFDVASWSMSTADDVVDTEVEVRLGDTVLGSFPLDNTVGDEVYDRTGRASVAVTLPATAPVGVAELTLVGATTGTQVPVAVDVVEPVLNTQRPTVIGVPRVGRYLKTDGGEWQPDAERLSYRWLADGVPIKGATGRKIQLTTAQLGKRISVRVTAHADGFAPATATSAETDRVRRGTVTLRTNILPTGPLYAGRTYVTLGVRPVNVNGIVATGKVRVRIGARYWTGTLRDGRVRVPLGRFGVGLRTVTVRYLGNRALAPKKDYTSFYVQRR